jgi:hypothetical protein
MLLGVYDEHNASNGDDEGMTNVKKKQYCFLKIKWKDLDAQRITSKSERLLSDELICNVNVKVCCHLNCCQYFPRENTSNI